MSRDFNYEEAVTKCKTMEDTTGPDGLIQKIIKDAVQHVLEQEINGYITSEQKKGHAVSRNGTFHKTLKTSYEKVGIDVPRTRNDQFEPEIIKKRSVVEGGLGSQVISMYAKAWPHGTPSIICSSSLKKSPSQTAAVQGAPSDV